MCNKKFRNVFNIFIILIKLICQFITISTNIYKSLALLGFDGGSDDSDDGPIISFDDSIGPLTSSEETSPDSSPDSIICVGIYAGSSSFGTGAICRGTHSASGGGICVEQDGALSQTSAGGWTETLSRTSAGGWSIRKTGKIC